MNTMESYSSNEEVLGQLKVSIQEKGRKKVDNPSRSKGKELANEELAQKKQRSEPPHFATSRNLDSLMIIKDQPLDEIKIPSPIHEGNVMSVQQEDEEPTSPIGTKILESDNEIDILGNEFQEGIISALQGAQDIPCEESNQEKEGIEQPTILHWLKERSKVKVPVEVQEEEDDTVDFLARLGKVATKKPT